MTKADLVDLGKRVEQERVARGWSKEEAARQAGISSITWKRVEDGLRVQDVKLQAVLKAVRVGSDDSSSARASVDDDSLQNDAEDLLQIPARLRGANSWHSLNERLDEVQADFETAIARLASAEQEYDSVTRYWASTELMRQAAEPVLTEREGALGRPLTREERAEVVGRLPRPNAAEVAEMVAWMAMHEPREWTRHEMALIEMVFDYPQDGRVGSGYADLEPARDRVRRMGFGDSDEVVRELPTKLTPVYRGVDPAEPTSAEATSKETEKTEQYRDRAAKALQADGEASMAPRAPKVG